MKALIEQLIAEGKLDKAKQQLFIRMAGRLAAKRFVVMAGPRQTLQQLQRNGVIYIKSKPVTVDE